MYTLSIAITHLVSAACGGGRLRFLLVAAPVAVSSWFSALASPKISLFEAAAFDVGGGGSLVDGISSDVVVGIAYMDAPMLNP